MVGTVSLDPLPLKRILAIDENGTELFPPEQAPEEKARAVLQRIDFEESDVKDAKKAKTSKEQLTSKWPWQGLIENLQLAHQELAIILDHLSHIEANDSITVANMVKPKQLLSEMCSELALRAASKLHNFKKVGKYLRQTAKALGQQVDREEIFYGALMRLQQHWKVKRLRMISAGPGGNAGFTIDLSYPQMAADVLLGLSARMASLYTVNVAQFPSGLLKLDLPGHQLNVLRMSLCMHANSVSAVIHCLSKEISVTVCEEENVSPSGSQVVLEKDVGEAINKGAWVAHAVLRKIQKAITDEMIFDWMVKEALQPQSGLVVSDIQEQYLRISLGNSHSLLLELKKNERWSMNGDKNMQADQKPTPKDQSEGGEDSNHELTNASPCFQGVGTGLFKGRNAIVFLQQAFYNSAFIHPQLSESSVSSSKPGLTKASDAAASNKVRELGIAAWRDPVEAVGPLRHFFLSIRHRVFSAKVLLELETLVIRVPHAFLSFHPTWHSRVTCWDLRVEIPKPVQHGWDMKAASWSSAKQKLALKHHLKVVITDNSISVEVLEPLEVFELASSRDLKMSRHRCELSELRGFLLCKLAEQLVRWLHGEAVMMGLKVRRDWLSLFIHATGPDKFVVAASIDADTCSVNWSLQIVSLKSEDEVKEDLSFYKGHFTKSLGSLGLESLRGIVADFLNSSNDENSA